MDIATAEWLVSDVGAAVVAQASAESDPSSLAAGERLRTAVGGDRAAAVLNQVVLRRRAAGKLGSPAERMWLTTAGLEQATRWRVATWRAAALWQAGARRVVDLGCGLGVDALACSDAGMDVVGVERDPVTAILAQANLRGVGRVVVGSAEDVMGEATGPVAEALADPATAVFVDPARRTGRGRSWDVSDLSPSWDFVSGLVTADRVTVVKLGPGFPDSLIPDSVTAVWVSDAGDLVECSLWAGGCGPTRRRAALLLPGEHLLLPTRRGITTSDRSPEPGDYLYEPDPAVIRAGGTDDLAATLGATRIAAAVPYLVAHSHKPTPFAASFRIIEVLPWDERALKRWVASAGIGTLEIKKRAIDVDPAALRKRLKPRGKHAATIVITPTHRRAVCLVVERLRPE